MRKNSFVIYNGKLFQVLEKRGNAVKIYDPAAKFPELTAIVLSINKVKPA